VAVLDMGTEHLRGLESPLRIGCGGWWCRLTSTGRGIPSWLSSATSTGGLVFAFFSSWSCSGGPRMALAVDLTCSRHPTYHVRRQHL
jgi:hypothetical protein